MCVIIDLEELDHSGQPISNSTQITVETFAHPLVELHVQRILLSQKVTGFAQEQRLVREKAVAPTSGERPVDRLSQKLGASAPMGAPA